MHTLEQRCETRALKRIKIERIIEEEENRIGLLPDCLLIEILSRLPTTNDAIKTGILSRRWRHLWPLVHNLVFTDAKVPNIDFYKLVDKTLAQCRHQLNKFKLNTYLNNLAESRVIDWVGGAINLNVQEIDLSSLHNDRNFDELLMFDSELFFINSNFTHLKLSCFGFNPPGAISWKNLKSLSITRAKLDEGLIQNMLSGSPVLETFKLEDCYFRRINITTKSVKYLELNHSLDYPPEKKFEGGEKIIEINAPSILTFTIPCKLSWKLVFLDVSSLAEANFDYHTMDPSYDIPEEQETLKELILSLRHVKKLKLGAYYSMVLSRLEAKGFSPQPNVVRWTNTWS